MKFKPITIEDVIYLLIFIGGIVIRFVDLGGASLSNYEASLALQALSLVKGLPEITLLQPFYTNCTAFLFFFFGANEFAARFTPALAGSLIILPIYLVKEKIGRTAALLLSFLLIVDPVLLSSSRQADSVIIAVVFTFLLLALFELKKKIWFGISLGLVLMVGSQLWTGWLGIIIAALLFRFFLVEDKSPIVIKLQETLSDYKLGNKGMIISALFTIGLGGSLFSIFPQLITSIFSSPFVYIQSWFAPAANPLNGIMIKLIGLAVYEPLALFCGVLGSFLIIIKRDKSGLFLIFWWIAAFIIGILYPSGKMNDLVWMIIPLWGITTKFLIWTVNIIEEDEKKWYGAFVAMTLFVIVFICMVTISYANNYSVMDSMLDPAESVKRVAVIFGGLVLLLSTTYLIGFGWSAKLAFSQWVGAMSLFLFAVSFSGGWSASGLNKNPALEMWRMGAYPTTGKLLEQTIDDYSRWNKGFAKLLDINAIGIDTPYLRWILRDQRNVNYQLIQTTPVLTNETPAMMITTVDSKPTSETAYRGSLFNIEDEPSWSLMSSQEWLKWAIFRKKVPMNQKTVILWIKNEMFPGGGTINEAISTSNISPIVLQDQP